MSNPGRDRAEWRLLLAGVVLIAIAILVLALMGRWWYRPPARPVAYTTLMHDAGVISEDAWPIPRYWRASDGEGLPLA